REPPPQCCLVRCGSGSARTPGAPLERSPKPPPRCGRRRAPSRRIRDPSRSRAPSRGGRQRRPLSVALSERSSGRSACRTTRRARGVVQSPPQALRVDDDLLVQALTVDLLEGIVI